MSTRKNPKTVLPDRVLVLGVPYQVQLRELVCSDDAEPGDTAGMQEGETRRIVVYSGLDSRRRWTTLLHEYMHATLYVVGLAGQDCFTEGTEEVVVQSLEHSLEQFLLAHGEQFLAALAVQKEDTL